MQQKRQNRLVLRQIEQILLSGHYLTAHLHKTGFVRTDQFTMVNNELFKKWHNIETDRTVC